MTTIAAFIWVAEVALILGKKNQKIEETSHLFKGFLLHSRLVFQASTPSGDMWVTDQNPGFFGLSYIRDHTTQIYKEYNKPIYGSRPQPTRITHGMLVTSFGSAAQGAYVLKNARIGCTSSISQGIMVYILRHTCSLELLNELLGCAWGQFLFAETHVKTAGDITYKKLLRECWWLSSIPGCFQK